MKIYAISSNYKISNSNFTSLKETQNVNAKEPFPKNSLIGVPKSYISFGDSNRISDAKRKAEIAKYLECKTKAKDIERGEEYYKERVQSRIDAIVSERSHYGRFSGNWKVGKVKKVERARIEKEEYAKYLQEKAEYKKVMDNEAYYKGLVSTEDIEIYEKVKEKLKDKAALGKKIAGYKQLKDTVKKLIIDPIQKETALDTTEKLPPALLLYGPIGCGKSELAKAIGEEANCNIIEFPKGTNPRKFAALMTDTIESARNYYEQQKNIIDNKYDNSIYQLGDADQKASYIANLKSPRTIVIVDEVDQYFNPNTKGNSEEIADINKTLLKGLLDHCSEKPDNSNSNDAAGVIFIFTTNYPSIVDSEISLRNGKCKRTPVSLPEDNDIKDIMKFYIIKSANPSIIEAKEKGLNVTPIDASQMPYNSYLKFVQPSEEKGAFSGAGIKSAVEQATANYIDNPENYINLQLAKLLSDGTYRIPMEKIKEYKQEMESMGKLLKDIDEKEEYELLKDLKELDMINPKQQTRFELLKSAYEMSEK